MKQDCEDSLVNQENKVCLVYLDWQVSLVNGDYPENEVPLARQEQQDPQGQPDQKVQGAQQERWDYLVNQDLQEHQEEMVNKGLEVRPAYQDLQENPEKLAHQVKLVYLAIQVELEKKDQEENLDSKENPDKWEDQENKDYLAQLDNVVLMDRQVLQENPVCPVHKVLWEDQEKEVQRARLENPGKWVLLDDLASVVAQGLRENVACVEKPELLVSQVQWDFKEKEDREVNQEIRASQELQVRWDLPVHLDYQVKEDNAENQEKEDRWAYLDNLVPEVQLDYLVQWESVVNPECLDLREQLGFLVQLD